jgi:ATP synthase protein I
MADNGDDGLDRRLSELGDQLAKRKNAAKQAGDGSRGANKSAYSQAVKVSSEFVAGIVAGALLGYLLDTLAGTSPWGLIVFLLLGFAAAVLNVLRSLGMVATPQPKKRDDAEK